MACDAYFSFTATFTLEETAQQDGVHTLVYSLYGTTWKMQGFEATTGQPFVIPNIFPEIGTFAIRIIQPDGTDYPFPECMKTITVLHACAGELECLTCE